MAISPRVRTSSSGQARLLARAFAGLLLSACAAESGPGEAVPPVADSATEPPEDAPEPRSGDGAPAPDVAEPRADSAAPKKCKPWVKCDDSLGCTIDGCIPAGDDHVCTWTVAEGYCLVHNACWKAGDASPDNPCAFCDPGTSRTGWTPRPTGAQCHDDVCQESFTCQGGVCVGDGTGCDDKNPCTVDACNPEVGCVAAPELDGLECQSKSACMVDAMCLAAVCIGAPLDCDDGDPCTLDECLPATGCKHTVKDGLECDDADACTAPDTCFGGECVSGPEASCDDGNPCSIDTCSPYVGCVHLPTQGACCAGLSSICDDGNPCTDETCDPETLECAYADNVKGCNDGSACTSLDVCKDGACKGAKITCDDGDPCTQDFCEPSTGCAAAPVSGGACDDGLACSTGDACVSGKCIGDESDCGCTIDMGWDAAKAKQYLIGVSGHPGEGLDVDGNAGTCAPSDDCSGGIDNAFAVLGPLANEALQKEVDKGKLMLLFQMPAKKSGTFELSMHRGVPDPGAAGCDFQATKCDYWLDEGGLDPNTCEAKFSVPCSLSGSKLACGGPGTTLPVDIPVQGAVVLSVAIFAVQLEADVTLAGGDVTGLIGMLGGAIRKDALMKAVDSLDDEGLPIPKDLIKTLLGTLLEYDIDTDGNGVPDAASIGFKMTFIDAAITGVKP